MSKFKVQTKSKVQIKILTLKVILTLSCFDIHLAFACLREAASAKAGILTFAIPLTASLSPKRLCRNRRQRARGSRVSKL
jgi:hypothetical protein